MCLSLIDKYIYFEERGRKCECGWYVYFLIIRPREFSTCYWVVVLQWKNGGLRLWIVRGERVLKTCTKEKGKTYITSLEKCTATAVKKQTNTRSTRLQSTWGIVCVFAKPFHFLPQQKIKIKKTKEGLCKNKQKQRPMWIWVFSFCPWLPVLFWKCNSLLVSQLVTWLIV